MNKLRKIAATITLMALCVFNFTGSSMQAQAVSKTTSAPIILSEDIWNYAPNEIPVKNGVHILQSDQKYQLSFLVENTEDLRNLILKINQIPEVIAKGETETISWSATTKQDGTRKRKSSSIEISAETDMMLAVYPFLRVQTTEDPYYLNIFQSPTKGVRTDIVKELPTHLLKKDGAVSVAIYFYAVPLSNWAHTETDEDGFAVRDENGSPISGGSGI